MSGNFIKRRPMLLAGLTGLAAPRLARASTYPDRPIRLVIPYGGGGQTDIVSRVTAEALQQRLGQPVLSDNRPGGAGNLAAEMVSRAPGDGYTILVATMGTNSGLNALLYKSVGYNAQRDFTPVGMFCTTSNLLMVHNSIPGRDFNEVAAWIKANPGKLAYGHGSSGSLVSAAMLCEMAGLQTVSVPYKGIPPAMTDLLGGQLQFAFADVGNAVSQINGGRMRGLGVTTRKRAGKAPTVPSIGDTVKDYNVSAWFGLMAPAGLPADVHKKASAAFLAVLAKPEVREKIQGVGIDLDVEDSATLAKTIDAEIKKWGGWVKAAGITPE